MAEPVVDIESDLQGIQVKDEGADDDLGERNIFKDEWRDSDVIFIVEKTKFHVHRGLLSLISPVFEAMFNSDFREKEQREIPLPGKKAEVFLSFLLIVYSRDDDNEVNLGNVSDLLMLSDEYQMSQVKKECLKLLMSAALEDQTAVDFLLLAQTYGLNDLKAKCHAHLRSVELVTLKRLEGFQKLDGDSVREMLIPQLEKAKETHASLKKLLEEVYGLLIASLECIIHLTTKTEDYNLNLCPKHYDTNGKANKRFQDRLRSCFACQALFNSISTVALTTLCTTDCYSGTSYTHLISRYGFNPRGMALDIKKLMLKVMDILGK